MDEGFSRAVTKVFVELYRRGLAYRAKRLVNWDPKFQTAISDLEVENREVKGHMWHFKYPLADGETYTYVERDAEGNIVLEEERDYISIATTSGKSRARIASRNNGPIPGHAITISTSSAAPSSVPRERPNSEISGFSAAGKR